MRSMPTNVPRSASLRIGATFGLLVLVTDEHPCEVCARRVEDVLLHVAVTRALGVRDDRHAGVALRERGAREHPALGVGDLEPGGRLDRARTDPGVGDPLAQLGDVVLGHLFGVATCQ